MSSTRVLHPDLSPLGFIRHSPPRLCLRPSIHPPSVRGFGEFAVSGKFRPPHRAEMDRGIISVLSFTSSVAFGEPVGGVKQTHDIAWYRASRFLRRLESPVRLCRHSDTFKFSTRTNGFRRRECFTDAEPILGLWERRTPMSVPISSSPHGRLRGVLHGGFLEEPIAFLN
jgi:hypothetical protein